MPRVIAQLPEHIQKLFNDQNVYHINPTGKFVIGGPHGDSGLTGRKIIVDTYGGKGAHGGGAFSGKDPSKVDRSGAYAARHIAKNLLRQELLIKFWCKFLMPLEWWSPWEYFIDSYGQQKVDFSDSEIAEK